MPVLTRYVNVMGNNCFVVAKGKQLRGAKAAGKPPLGVLDSAPTISTDLIYRNGNRFMLNDKCLLILAAIMDGAVAGKPPTIRGLAQLISGRVSIVHYYVRKLGRLGLVRWEPKKARTLWPTCRFASLTDNKEIGNAVERQGHQGGRWDANQV